MSSLSLYWSSLSVYTLLVPKMTLEAGFHWVTVTHVPRFPGAMKVFFCINVVSARWRSSYMDFLFALLNDFNLIDLRSLGTKEFLLVWILC